MEVIVTFPQWGVPWCRHRLPALVCKTVAMGLPESDIGHHRFSGAREDGTSLLLTYKG